MTALQKRNSDMVELLKPDFVTRLEFFAAALTLEPTGSGRLYFGATAPTGYLLCDGSAVSRATYAALFAVVGVTYGAGDGITTFNLPDLRQRFPLGLAVAGTGNVLGGVGGAIDHAHGSPLTTGAPSGTVTATPLVVLAADGTHTHDLTVPTDNPPYLVVNFIIKT